MEPNETNTEVTIPSVDDPILSNPSSEDAYAVHSDLPVGRQLLVALGILVVVFGATYVGTIAALVRPTTNAQDVIVEKKPVVRETKAAVSNAFDGVTIGGKAAFVWDVNEQRALFNKNADEQLPLASITKLMTALVAYELLDDTDDVNVSLRAIQASGDSGLYDGEPFKARDLTDLVLISSSNDGATALADTAGASLELPGDPISLFIDAMNIRAEELGLSETYFNNVTGLDVGGNTAGAYGSARDVVFLMEHIITNYPDIVALTKVDFTKILNEKGEYHIAKNTNEVVGEINGLIASKTGYTELAGGNLVVAFDAGLNHPIIVAVLGSTQSGRFDDVLNLIERTRKQILASSE